MVYDGSVLTKLLSVFLDLKIGLQMAVLFRGLRCPSAHEAGAASGRSWPWHWWGLDRGRDQHPFDHLDLEGLTIGPAEGLQLVPPIGAASRR